MSLTQSNGRIMVNTKVTSDQPAAPGRVRLRIEKVEVKYTGEASKTPGAPYLVMRLRVIGGADEGKSVFQNFMIEGGGRFRFEHLCKATGLDGHEDLDIENFEGREFEAELHHEEYEGRKQAKVKKIFYTDDDDEGVVAAGAAVGAGMRSTVDDDEGLPF